MANSFLKNKKAIMATLVMVLMVTYIDMGQWLLLDVNGTIVTSMEAPKSGNSHSVMVYTRYVIHMDTGENKDFLTDGQGGDLDRSMPVGTTIHKNKWELDYVKNGTLNRYSFLSISLNLLLMCLILYPAYAWIFKAIDTRR